MTWARFPDLKGPRLQRFDVYLVGILLAALLVVEARIALKPLRIAGMACIFVQFTLIFAPIDPNNPFISN